MIRSAKEKDIEAINILGKLVNKDFVKLFNMKEILEEEFSKVFVVEEKNKIIGFLHITELYETIDIINIVIDANNRHKGMATLLMDYMISDARPEVEIVTLEVATNNEAAINLYQKFGFEIISTRKSYYSGIDAYLMGKRMHE